MTAVFLILSVVLSLALVSNNIEYPGICMLTKDIVGPATSSCYWRRPAYLSGWNDCEYLSILEEQSLIIPQIQQMTNGINVNLGVAIS